MTKISRPEMFMLGVTIILVLLTVGWFYHQNQNPELVRIAVSRNAAPVDVVPLPEETDPAPGLLEGERININTAPAIDLERLPEIGSSRAKDIVAYREEKGPFKTVESILEVAGIGQKTFEMIVDYITVSEGGDVDAKNSGGG